ncbi:hypothetical protein [Photobacterium sp. GB-72]|uniref:hypothetical protein n=1 Tax=Photobacterium sp. GB-72 TaxID=2022105 RepID=UPI0011B2337F|nr:hypothetical protein [Photobacterium sp. GB-72]
MVNPLLSLNQIILVIVLASLSHSALASKAKVSVPAFFQQVAEQKKLPRDLLYAIALKESGTTTINHSSKHKKYRAWPWTMNYAKKGHFFRSRSELFTAANNLVKAGKKVVDVCPMQMNWKWHSHRFESLWHATDPYKCIPQAANYLIEISNMPGRKSWSSIVGGYHNLNRSVGDPYAKGVKRICKKYKLKCFL